MSEIELEALSWEQIYEMLLNLADKIKRDDFKPDILVGICRGGWPPARVLSDLLENPQLANIKVEFYAGISETKSEPIITQPVSVSVMGKKVLVVDDVADTGESLYLVKRHIDEMGATEVKVATIYYKPWSKLVPDYYEKKASEWVVFPWERKETVTSLIKKYLKNGKSVEEAKRKLIGSGMSKEHVEKFMKEVLENLGVSD